MSEYAESVDTLLGQEFLTWLWYKSEVAPDSFVTSGGDPFSVSMEQRIVVQGGNGEAKETASVTGAFSPLSEARFGLGTGKKVARALLHMEKDGMSFQCMAKADDFSLNSMKTPKIEAEKGEDDPDALLLEKIYLLECCVDLWDTLYKNFIDLRLSEHWESEVLAMRQWMSRSVSA